MTVITVKTAGRAEMIDITSQVENEISRLGFKDGFCVLHVPHTTAAVTINEGADPAVKADILMELNKTIPLEDGYRHSEGNSAAHIKTSLVGCSQLILVEDGRPVLGTWQRIFFCEFDGPRTRKVLFKCVG